MFSSVDTFSEICTVLDSHGYNILKEIGRGGSARCYLVFSRQYRDLFVVKVITGLSKSRAECEPSALKDLMHPNVIYLYEIVSTQSALYLFLELCPGGSLMHILTTHGGFSGRQLSGLCKAVLTGLCYIHSMRWAHLDLKPDNILFDKHGRPKLADFGISLLLEGKEGTLKRGGTIEFAAPELMKKERYDPFKADIWSFAMTVYFTAFVQFPFPVPVLGEEELPCAALDIPFPMDTDSMLMDVIRAMLVRDPNARPSAMECLNMPWFANADVRDGWMDEKGNPLAKPEVATTMRLTRSATLKPTGQTLGRPGGARPKKLSPVTW
jgi:serine/threonine protein kinase